MTAYARCTHSRFTSDKDRLHQIQHRAWFDHGRQLVQLCSRLTQRTQVRFKKIRTDRCIRLVTRSRRRANQQSSCGMLVQLPADCPSVGPKIPTCWNFSTDPIGQSGTVSEVVSTKIQGVHTYPTANRLHRATCLDLVMVNSSEKHQFDVTCVPVPISDHSLVVVNYKCKIQNLPDISGQKRKFLMSHENIRLKTREHFENVDHANDDVHQVYSDWTTTAIEVLDTVAPVKDFTIKAAKLPQPWLTSELVEAHRKRNRLHAKYIKSRTAEHYASFCEARNISSSLNKQLKCKYFQQQCSASVGNARMQWKVINEITRRNRWRPPPIAPIADLSSTFGNIVTDEARPDELRLPACVPNKEDFFEFQPVTTTQIENEIRAYDCRKAAGSDGLFSRSVVCKHSFSQMTFYSTSLVKSRL